MNNVIEKNCYCCGKPSVMSDTKHSWCETCAHVCKVVGPATIARGDMCPFLALNNRGHLIRPRYVERLRKSGQPRRRIVVPKAREGKFYWRGRWRQP